MFGCDYIIALADSHNPIELWDQYANTHLTPPNDEDLGGRNDLVYISGGYVPLINNTTNRVSGKIEVKFKRKLDTGDIFDKVLYPDMEVDINWGYRVKDSDYVQPDFFQCLRIKLAKNIESFESTELSPKTQELLDHGFLISFFWVIIAPIGILVARYCKQY